MQNDQEQENITDLTGRMIGQSLDHFDPFQGLIDNEEKAEQLRNMRYGFKLGAHYILIDNSTPCEVVQSAQIYRIPNTPSWVLGVINLRGNLVPVFDFMKRLDEKTSLLENRRLLVLEQGERAIGIYIEGLPKALEIDPENPEQRAAIPTELPMAIRGHVTGAYRATDNIWLEIDHRALFAELLADSGISADTLT